MSPRTPMKTEVVATAEYLFEVYRESAGSWYVNATAKDGFFFYKWTTGASKKEVLRNIGGLHERV